MIYFYTSLITYFIYTILKYKESLILLQKNNYDSKKYKKDIPFWLDNTLVRGECGKYK